MDTTHASLLIRVKDPRDTAAWTEFHDLYAPLLYRYARARGLSHEDAEDVRATCYEALVRQLPHFEYEKQKGKFKAWLRTLVTRRVVDLLRKRRETPADVRELDTIASREPPPDEVWEQHWRQQHLYYCVEQAKRLVPPRTYEVFHILVHENCPAAEVAARLDLTTNQVYKAKARVLQVVRELLEIHG